MRRTCDAAPGKARALAKAPKARNGASPGPAAGQS